MNALARPPARRLAVALTLAAAALLAVPAVPVPAWSQPSEGQGPSAFDDLEMGARPGAARSAQPGATPSPEAVKQFEIDYRAAGRDTRPVFEKHLGLIGAEAILDVLEAVHPLCHGQAHQLGRAILAREGAVGPALRACKTRCTSGCMHGVLMEAFVAKGAAPAAGGHEHPAHPAPEQVAAPPAGGATAGAAPDHPAHDQHGKSVAPPAAGHDQHAHHQPEPARPGQAAAAPPPLTVEEVAQRILPVCAVEEMATMHKPGNCAHGIGHALMALTAGDLGRSLELCGAFGRPAMAYYCATGVFMEFHTSQRQALQGRPLHFPCDAHPFPAACYRYRGQSMLRALGGYPTRLAEECLALPRARRLGCFHGLGAAAISNIARSPGLLPAVCSHGSAEDQAMCIEGAIEKLGDYDEARAQAACATMAGEGAAVCQAAAREKMYRLDKPTMPLYAGQ